ncbi:M14 metallopeptidase family protein [Roseisolibacter sp. H3M3-2]|uniref:M14 family metallopeptidase n=1 Tax=Roseisolibacter sp. H3M3-2 TaxID=3031323 RepID=UPI0023DC054E|nr:M14 metallopeptidase family protein [Roseisolibacter sp. H3M3-2]MDF1503011.1 M14 family metallopeptidase [Roseisolibacter sp. H3M3-2]
MSFPRLARRSLAGLLLATPALAGAQPTVTSPQKFFGHRIGADYQLPNYTKFTAYWRQLDGESERMRVLDIGKTAEGRSQLMAIVTAPENFRTLARYKEISQRLAKAEGLTEAQARQLAAEGKAVVWIDGGLHATEVLGAQQLIETVYQLVSRDDAETRRILRDVIILATHANPDGMELVSDWYMREPDSLKRSTGGIPRLYQKYIGHDNNRDFYMSTQPESENMNRQLYHEWFPQIMYNHHQTGPTGTVMFAPPFRDPFNYQLDPLIVTGLDLVGAAMHNRFIAEDKGGVTMRRGANYSTWWNGGLRTTVYFHNMIGLLTETIGNPTPMRIPFVANRQLPSADLPLPIAPQEWKFRNSIDYSVTANYAVLDVASRYKDTFLYNIWRMGRNSIEHGGKDSWTVSPSRLDAVRDSMQGARAGGAGGAGGPAGVMTAGGQFGGAANAEQSQRYLAMMRRPEARDPRGYVIPADQPDFPRAVHLINALRENGITVHRATAAFSANGKQYPAGSWVLKSAQPFRPHILDMFEPQDHPNDFLYPGGPPIPPYDAAGWTLAYQMGVKFDRLLDGFDGPFEEVKDWNVKPAPGTVASGSAAGYVLSAKYNDAFPAAVRLVGAGEEVYRLTAPHAGHPAGSFFVVAGANTRARLQPIAAELGMNVAAASSRPAGGMARLKAPRVALWDRYGGSMPSGWTRWLLEQKKIPFDVVYAPQLDAGNLRAKYDAIVLVDGAIPARDGQGGGFGGGEPRADAVPADLRATLGNTSVAKTVPQLKTFLEQGGTVITIGGSTALARHLGLPVGDKLVDAQGKALPREQFYVPGSVLRVAVDTTQPAAFGMESQADVFFDDSPAFTLGADAEARGVKRVAWYDSASPLRSGWAWGQKHLEGGAAAVEAKVGQGTLFLFGPEILYRAQPHGTFKFFFNSLAASAASGGAIQ